MSTFNSNSKGSSIGRHLSEVTCDKPSEPQGPIAEEINHIKHVLSIQDELIARLRERISDVCIPVPVSGNQGAEKSQMKSLLEDSLANIRSMVLRRNDMIREMIEAVQL